MSKLFWKYGCMGAGKSIALLTVAHNYERIGQTTRIFTAALDDRYGAGVVASRLGISKPAALFKPRASRTNVFA
jgi:thymidine kinase